MSLVSTPSRPLTINVFQASNPKGNKKSNGKNKGWNNKKKDKDGKGNANKSNDNVREGKREVKKKVNFTCKLCTGDHLTHLYPKIQDSQ